MPHPPAPVELGNRCVQPQKCLDVFRRVQIPAVHLAVRSGSAWGSISFF